MAGCAAIALAAVKAIQGHESEAARARENAEKALREALVLDPEMHEARLRLGTLLLDEQRAMDAEPLLAEVDAKATEDRQRYLARLFLGRAADRGGRPGEAMRSYQRALEVWPDSQAAGFGLAHALEESSGPAAARARVGVTLDPSRWRNERSDPWFLYLTGPPGLADATFRRVWSRTPRP